MSTSRGRGHKSSRGARARWISARQFHEFISSDKMPTCATESLNKLLTSNHRELIGAQLENNGISGALNGALNINGSLTGMSNITRPTRTSNINGSLNGTSNCNGKLTGTSNINCSGMTKINRSLPRTNINRSLPDHLNGTSTEVNVSLREMSKSNGSLNKTLIINTSLTESTLLNGALSSNINGTIKTTESLPINCGSIKDSLIETLKIKETLNGSSSISSSPCSPSTSPIGILKRSRSATPTTSDFFQEHFTIKSDWRSSQNVKRPKEEKSLFVQILGWYPCFLFNILQATIAMFVPAACIRTLLALPMLCVTAWLWMFVRFFDIPIAIIKWFFDMFYFPSMELFRKKRTVLISGGSSIQTLHLARNFYSAGSRVIVCETEGLFALARFSTAVSKFYTLPKPSVENYKNYVRSLCDIVQKEGAVYYIPVNATNSCYFDSLAKPTLELMGCQCFCPNLKEVLVLDDSLQVFQRCVQNGIPTPAYFSITSKNTLEQFYQRNFLHNKQYILKKSGPMSKEKSEITLPRSINELNIEATETNPWVIVEKQHGEHYITCTTVKQSQVIANVTCKLDENKCLMPITHKEIEQWLQNFFSKLNFTYPVSGHFTFKLLVTKNTNTILPISCKLGVSLPYICHTSVHPRILCKPCKHFNRQSSGPLVVDKGRYWMHNAFLNAMKRPSVESVTRFIGTVLDMREVLFVYWDPLPYWAYYHLKLPLRNILRFLQQRRFGFDQLPVQF